MTVRDNLRLLRLKPEILLVCATAACGGLLFGYDLGKIQTQGPPRPYIAYGGASHRCGGKLTSAVALGQLLQDLLFRNSAQKLIDSARASQESLVESPECLHFWR